MAVGAVIVLGECCLKLRKIQLNKFVSYGPFHSFLYDFIFI